MIALRRKFISARGCEYRYVYIHNETWEKICYFLRQLPFELIGLKEVQIPSLAERCFLFRNTCISCLITPWPR